MKLRKTTAAGLFVLALGALCALAATPIGMLKVQRVVGIGTTFSVGKAHLSTSDRWLLLDYRDRSGAPHIKLGFIASRDNGSLPQGRYYSFEDVDSGGHATFVEIDHETVTRVKEGVSSGLGCWPQPVSAGRNLVRCQTDTQQVLLYDLDRAFFVGVSSKDARLLEQVLNVIAK